MLNIGVVGLGWWGRTIVQTLLGNAKLRVVTATDLNPAANSFTRKHGIDFAADFEAMLANRELQGVVLCTPHTQHCGQILRAAAAGKHVYCEKPLSLNRTDAARAVAACNAAGVALAVGHERRFEPPILELMAQLKSGVLGTPLQIEANFSQDKFLALAPDNWRLSSAEAPAGPMTATGIHLLDLSIGVFGPAESAFASVRQLGSGLVNGDTLAVLLTFHGGGHALISAILATPFAGRFAIYGSKGWLEVVDRTHPEAPEGWTVTRCLRGERPVSTASPPVSGVLANLEAFADAAAGRAAYPVPQEQMIANIAAFEAVVKSTRSGRVENVEGDA